MSVESNELHFAKSIATIGLAQSDPQNLRRSLLLTEDRVNTARAVLAEQLADHNHETDVVAFGSMARGEVTGESDFDYLVVTYGLDPEPGSARRVLAAADRLRHEMGEGEVPRPGTTGLFGTIVAGPDLVERIGLEQDTNHSQTRRILLLEESVSLLRTDKHDLLIKSIVGRYLSHRVQGATTGVPRFLINDISRYWRTLTVDYQAKTASGSPYSLRYLKLIVSRKATYVASLAPIVTGRDIRPEELEDHLIDNFKLPAIVRLADFGAALVEEDSSLRQPFQDLFNDLDQFNAWLGDKGWREAIKTECQAADPRDAENFAAARELGKRVQRHLQEIFFSRHLRDFSEAHLIF